MTAIGIDFGTTNSVAARFSGGISEVIKIGDVPADWAQLGFDLVLPSVVALDERQQMIFGWDAKRAQPDEVKVEAIKRLFKEEESVQARGETFYVEEIATALFRHIRNRVVEHSAIDFESAVITVPANSRGLARHRTKVCAGMGGIQPLALLNEPTAAAMAFSRRQITDDQTLLVFDLGGGTLDVTVLETKDGLFFEQASAGEGRLGGVDFDNAILRAITEELPDSASWTGPQKSQLKLEVEQAKIRLSNSDVDETLIQNEFIPNGYRLTRPRFNDLTRSLVERSAPPIQKVLADLRMQTRDIDVLLLVGGSSKVPAVRQIVSEVLDMEPATGIDPMTAVGEGAALAAAILTGELDDHDFFVSTEHALGTLVVNPTTGPSFAPVIPRNQKLPARQSATFYPVFDEQESVLVNVLEGDPDLPVDHPDNLILTSFEVPIDPPRSSREAGFELTYAYDTDGLLHIEATDPLTGATLTDRVTVSFTGAREGRELVEIAGRVRAAVDHGAEAPRSPASESDDPRSRALLIRAKSRVLPFLDDNDGIELRAAVEALETAESAAEVDAQSRVEEALRPYSYLF